MAPDCGRRVRDLSWGPGYETGFGVGPGPEKKIVLGVETLHVMMTVFCSGPVEKVVWEILCAGEHCLLKFTARFRVLRV